MLRTLTGAATVAAVAVLIGASSAPRADDRALIIQTRREQNAAIARGDLAATASAWTQDVSVRAGLGRNLQGRQQYVDAFVADSTMRYVREPIEVVVSTKWPLAYERGRWTGFRRGVAKDSLLSGQYSAQWVKSGSRWLIRSEVFVALDCNGSACAWPAAAP
jgi:ketosteroid isomerase-like protein